MRRARSRRCARRAATLGVLGVLGVLGACTDDAPAGADTTATLPRECASEAPELQVDRIGAAVGAVEAQRGGPQQYYEINATARLVNLFVAGDEPGQVVPYVFLDQELTSEAPLSGASGNTFTADAIDVDPLRVTSCVRDQLPGSSLDVFEVLGGSDGTAQYSILVSSASGGRLIVMVDRAGAVLGVDPVDPSTSVPATGASGGAGSTTPASG